MTDGGTNIQAEAQTMRPELKAKAAVSDRVWGWTVRLRSALLFTPLAITTFLVGLWIVVPRRSVAGGVPATVLTTSMGAILAAGVFVLSAAKAELASALAVEAAAGAKESETLLQLNSSGMGTYEVRREAKRNADLYGKWDPVLELPILRRRQISASIRLAQRAAYRRRLSTKRILWRREYSLALLRNRMKALSLAGIEPERDVVDTIEHHLTLLESGDLLMRWSWWMFAVLVGAYLAITKAGGARLALRPESWFYAVIALLVASAFYGAITSRLMKRTVAAFRAQIAALPTMVLTEAEHWVPRRLHDPTDDTLHDFSVRAARSGTATYLGFDPGLRSDEPWRQTIASLSKVKAIGRYGPWHATLLGEYHLFQARYSEASAFGLDVDAHLVEARRLFQSAVRTTGRDPVAELGIVTGRQMQARRGHDVGDYRSDLEPILELLISLPLDIWVEVIWPLRRSSEWLLPDPEPGWVAQADLVSVIQRRSRADRDESAPPSVVQN